MKLYIDPMPMAREAKKAAVNRSFSAVATQDLHRDLAHMMKAQWAKSDRAKLKAEADLRGITVNELADLVLTKSADAIADRELRRQEIMKRIEAAQSPADLDAI
jgi:hypothetical protein